MKGGRPSLFLSLARPLTLWQKGINDLVYWFQVTQKAGHNLKWYSGAHPLTWFQATDLKHQPASVLLTTYQITPVLKICPQQPSWTTLQFTATDLPNEHIRRSHQSRCAPDRYGSWIWFYVSAWIMECTIIPARRKGALQTQSCVSVPVPIVT